jgi:hypothetical protein
MHNSNEKTKNHRKGAKSAKESKKVGMKDQWKFLGAT